MVSARETPCVVVALMAAHTPSVWRAAFAPELTLDAGRRVAADARRIREQSSQGFVLDGGRYSCPVSADAALIGFVRAIVRGDHPSVSELLTAAPELAMDALRSVRPGSARMSIP